MFGDGNELVGAIIDRPLALILNRFRRATNGRPYDRVYLKLTDKPQFTKTPQIMSKNSQKRGLIVIFVIYYCVYLEVLCIDRKYKL